MFHIRYILPLNLIGEGAHRKCLEWGDLIKSYLEGDGMSRLDVSFKEGQLDFSTSGAYW